MSGGESHSAVSNSKCLLRVIRDRGRVSRKSGYVRSAPKATELLRRHEMTRWASSGHAPFRSVAWLM
jgi:hypothetical protein